MCVDSLVLCCVGDCGAVLKSHAQKINTHTHTFWDFLSLFFFVRQRKICSQKNIIWSHHFSKVFDARMRNVCLSIACTHTRNKKTKTKTKQKQKQKNKDYPTIIPSNNPTMIPVLPPSVSPSIPPSMYPTYQPLLAPSNSPSKPPS